MSDTVAMGKITKGFNYEVVMGSPVLGIFVMIPELGDYSGQTIAIEVKRNTQVNGKLAASQMLDQVLLEGEAVVILLEDAPKEIITTTWTAVAKYSANALAIAVQTAQINSDFVAILNVNSVNVYPYIHWNPKCGIGPVIMPVIENASGIYEMSSAGMKIGSSLMLNNVIYKESIQVGSKYIAYGNDEDGNPFSTPPMRCVEAGENPVFSTIDNIE